MFVFKYLSQLHFWSIIATLHFKLKHILRVNDLNPIFSIGVFIIYFISFRCLRRHVDNSIFMRNNFICIMFTINFGILLSERLTHAKLIRKNAIIHQIGQVWTNLAFKCFPCYQIYWRKFIFFSIDFCFEFNLTFHFRLGYLDCFGSYFLFMYSRKFMKFLLQSLNLNTLHIFWLLWYIFQYMFRFIFRTKALRRSMLKIVA